jgi:8-oxo-dGTP pyrophosphatase MutT (NUDIX family)
MHKLGNDKKVDKGNVTLMNHEELLLNLEDNEWPLTTIDHDRLIARAIVVDDEKNFYFVRANRDDDFGKATLIETAGGGVEAGEDLNTAIRRELKEELGVDVKVICKIGVVSDYYNLIHRHNINNYFLCRIVSFGEKHLTKDEIEDFHLSTLKLKYEEALAEYERCRCTSLGRLVANREYGLTELTASDRLEGIRRTRAAIKEGRLTEFGDTPAADSRRPHR